MQQKFDLSITYNKAWRGIHVAKETLYGSMEEAYNLVDALRDELLVRNSGSHILILGLQEKYKLQSFPLI